MPSFLAIGYTNRAWKLARKDFFAHFSNLASCTKFHDATLFVINLSTQSESRMIRIFNGFLYDANARGHSCISSVG